MILEEFQVGGGGSIVFKVFRSALDTRHAGRHCGVETNNQAAKRLQT